MAAVTLQMQKDLVSEYQLNASGRVAKPSGFRDFLRVIASTEDFRLSAHKLPGKTY